MLNKQGWNSWKLNTDAGRQRWSYVGERNNHGKVFEDFVYNKSENPNSADRVYRAQQVGLLTNLNPLHIPYPDNLEGEISHKAFQAAYKGIHFYSTLQTPEGHWPGDYGGPMFLLPGLVIASYVTETPFPESHQALMKQYFLNHQNPDGGWGLHLEGKSTMFGTVLQYVALRLLGMEKDTPQIINARQWILANGGATGLPGWGKFYLSVLGVYEWEGNNSLFPEMWTLPQWLPFHPGRYWCHARMVYLPMAYCYGHKVIGRQNNLIAELRKELYTQDYASVDWVKARESCAEPDLYYPQSAALKLMNRALNVYEKFKVKSWRKKAVDFCLDYINAEDEHTNYIDIGPVNQVINSIAIYHAYGKDSVRFKKHAERWADYLWVAEDGMKMQGYNGSQLWDTVFATQAILEGGMEKYFPETVSKAFNFIDHSQVKEEVRDHKKYFRHDSVGGWPFSTADHGWPITDCTAEGLKTALLVEPRNKKQETRQQKQEERHKREDTIQEKQISDERLKKAADLLLSMQNSGGGWASYELTRAPEWIELLNPSEVFGNIMVDYSYTECSSACIQSLAEFKKNLQREDGSWYGSWAVCFTYGTWFAIEALTKAETGIQSAEINAAIERTSTFLLSKQKEDGGWGESFESCIEKEYIEHPTSQVVNTSWALLSLMEIEKLTTGAKQQAIKTAIEKGMRLLISRQQPTGDWPQESISGVFNHNCMISYTSYRNVFPIWALGRYLKG